MKKVIVTGADGFIGSNLIKKLINENVEVWAVIYPQSKTKARIYELKSVHCIECEISELILNIEKFPSQVDAFYHFAWQGVNANDRDDLELQMKNINLCFECIKAASLVKAQKFILPGSTSEYLYYGMPINESAIPSPQNAYGSVKVALRYLAKQYAAQLKVEFIYVVITGIYAADRKDNNVIFYTIDKLLRGEKPSLTKLEQAWDYVHIIDVIDALMLIGDKGKGNSFYAIGHGDNQPLYKYIDIIHECIDPEAPLGIGDIPYKDNRLPSSCIDLSALYKDTGFVPQIDFKDGIKDVIDTMKREMSI